MAQQNVHERELDTSRSTFKDMFDNTLTPWNSLIHIFFSAMISWSLEIQPAAIVDAMEYHWGCCCPAVRMMNASKHGIFDFPGWNVAHRNLFQVRASYTLRTAHPLASLVYQYYGPSPGSKMYQFLFTMYTYINPHLSQLSSFNQCRFYDNHI